MVTFLKSPTLLPNSTFVVVAKRTSNGARFDKPDIIAEFYFCSCSVKQNGHQMVPVLTIIIAGFYFFSVKQNGHQMVPLLTIIIAGFYFCSCENQNGHQMVPVLTSPTLQNSTFVVAVKIKTDIKWCPFCQARHYCRILYFCSCSENQNGHQMVPVLSNPPFQNTSFVAVVKIKTDIKWCPSWQARHHCRILLL